MKDISRRTPYLVISGIAIVLLIPFLLFNKGILIWYGDSFEQQLSFYLGGWEKFHSFDFSLWNWSLGLGASYLSYVFYFATSPFFLISLLLPKEWIVYAFLYFNVVKMTLLMVFSYWWLRSLSQLRIIALIGSLSLTFSGWVLFFFHYNHFLDAFILYPLILFFIERWLNNDEYIGLVLSIAALGVVNYYFLYMFVPFIGLYSVVRLIELNKSFPWKRLLHLVGMGLLSIGLSSFILLPSLYLVINNPRLSEPISLFSHLSLKDLYRYLSSIFFPVMKRFDPTYTLSTDVYSGLGWGGGVSLYGSILIPLMVPFAFMYGTKKSISLRILSYLVMGIFMYFMVFYKLFQGSIDVRWYYMITFLNLLTLIKGLNQFVSHQSSHKRVKWVALGILVILVLIVSITYFKGWYGSQANWNLLISSLIIIMMFLFAYSIALRHSLKIVLTFLIVEVLMSFGLVILNDQPMTKSEYDLTNIENTTSIDYLEETDHGFYRILNDTVLYSSPNEPFAKGYNGLSFYLSVYNFEQEDYLARLKGTWSMPQSFGRNYSYLLLSTKYYITKDYTHKPPYGFDFYKQIGDETIYINRFYFPLGFISDETLNEDTFKSLSYLNQDRLLLNTIVTQTSMNKEPHYMNELTQLYSWVDPSSLTIMTQDQDINVYIESFDIPAVTITHYGKHSTKLDDMLSTSYTWQYNYTGEFVKDADLIKIAFNNQYKSSTLVNVYQESNLGFYEDWYKTILNNSFTNVQVGKDRLSASLKVNKDAMWVFTSIPYDKGWEVKVNDQVIDYQKVNLGFIGFELDKGNYDVEFSFRPPYLILGSWISIASLVLLLLIRYRLGKQP